MELCSIIIWRLKTMNERNRELLEKVIETRLTDALELDAESDESQSALKEAMVAIDKETELTKMDIAHEEQNEKRKADEKFRDAESHINVMLRIIEVAAIPIGILIIDIVARDKFAKRICNFEKDYTFTTTPGRSLSSLFRFKR
jgi:hypothetical protein